MFLQPKKASHKKVKKIKLRKLTFKSHRIKFGLIGLKAASSGFISARQLEAARRIVTRKMQRKGKLWLRVFPNYPVTKKPNESRMGKGVGSVSFWTSPVSSGQILFEICGIPYSEAEEALRSGGHKLSIKTRLVKK